MPLKIDPEIGPLGLGLQVQLMIQNRQATVAGVPMASSFAIKALKEPRDKNIRHSGNLTLDQILDIARTMKTKSVSKDLAICAKEVLRTAQRIGCVIDGRLPQDIIDDINSGEIEMPEE